MRSLLAAILFAGAAASLAGDAAAQSRWATFDASARLIYGHFKTGDRIADFSFAGYRAGGVALPRVPPVRSVSPSGKDDTAAIQRAIDEVSAMPLRDGTRGAVLLAKGVFHCEGTLRIGSSGVVLRGDGRPGPNGEGTTLTMTGGPHLAIAIAGHLVQKPIGPRTFVTDSYVASGTGSFHVEDARGFGPGDQVLIQKPVTESWLHFLGMDALGVRNGKPEHWIDGTLDVRRQIAAVTGDRVTLGVPLMDSYDAGYLGPRSVTVTKVAVTGQIAEVGVEALTVAAPERHIRLGDPEFDGLTMWDAVDSWVRSVEFRETTSSVGIDRGTERVTVLDVNVLNHTTILGAPKPFDFQAEGTQILFDRCTATGDDTFYFVTQQKQQGPVVLLDCRFEGNGWIEPHQRWSTGLLVDNCEVPDGGIGLIDRGMMGTGHGWTTAWSVVWNSSAKTVAINLPPGTANWSIGNRGAELDPPQPAFDGAAPVALRGGIVEAAGSPVKPRSLYLQQLLERLGPQSWSAIGH